MAIASKNPATGETIKTFSAHSGTDIEAALRSAINAFAAHRQSPFKDRARKMRHAADVLEGDRDRLAHVITTEMGKLLQAAKDEIDKCTRCCRFYAEHASEFLEAHQVPTEARRSGVQFEPLGPVLAIMPWNFPFWQVFRFAVPAIMAGNVAILKHAANVPQCALAIEDIFRSAGFDTGIFKTLLIESSAVDNLIRDKRIKAVTLTGSDRAGMSVAESAGRELKKCVLELGGSDPFIVMPSADLEAAVSTGVKARTVNSGQSCIAAKRFILADAIYDDFISRFVQRMRGLKPGDPLDPSTDIAPLANESILTGVDEQVQGSIKAGAKVLAGGRRADRPGYFYEPTVLADIPKDAPAYREEVFGPVALMFRAANAEDALALANDSQFGLGSSVWTNDPDEQEFFSRGIEAGMVFVNAMVASDPRLPFGGVKRSGYGRELAGEGIREFTNVKTVYVA